jgi:hypothetical protein
MGGGYGGAGKREIRNQNPKEIRNRDPETGLPGVIVPAAMSDQSSNLPGRGFLGWLGRQVGHVAKAVKTDVTGPAAATPGVAPAEPRVVYRTGSVEQVPHPTEPGVLLRRTVVDEVVVTDCTGDLKSPGK